MESLRAQAHYFAPDRDPYEVWLDRYEHGLTIAQCDTFFAALRETIVPLLAAIKERGSAIRTDFLYQDWPIEQQRKLSKKIMEVWGLDPDQDVYKRQTLFCGHRGSAFAGPFAPRPSHRKRRSPW